jgi:sialate O-acetylesterase
MPRLFPLLLSSVLVTLAIAHTDEVQVLPCPLGPDTDMWVLAGQSNMQGSGILTRTYPPNPKVMMLDMSDAWLPAVPPIHRIYTATAPVYRDTILRLNPTLTPEAWSRMEAEARRRPPPNVGLEYFFASELVAATGRPVGLVPCALGSTTMADWDPAGLAQGEHSLYGNLIHRLRRAGGHTRGVLWYQGESDALSPAVGQFRTAFLHFIDCLRRDSGIPDLPVIYVQMARVCLEKQSGASGWDRVRELQRTMASERPNLWVVPAVDLPLDDYIHVGEAGHERLGHRLAEVALSCVYGLPGHGHALDFKSCEILPPLDVLHHRLRVTFSGVTGRIQAQGRPAGFELRGKSPAQSAPPVYKVELDDAHPDSVVVWYAGPITAPVELFYGAGLDPYVNLTDSLDMAVPSFGPVEISPSPHP